MASCWERRYSAVITGPASDTSSAVARPENWDMGIWSRVRPSRSRWEGASIWVPVWEQRLRLVVRNPSLVRVADLVKAGAGSPG